MAFYNYIQSFVPFGYPPTAQQWKEAAAPFEMVLRCLDPDAVLICGRRLSGCVEYRPVGVTFATIKHPRGGLAYADAIWEFRKMLQVAGGSEFGVVTQCNITDLYLDKLLEEINQKYRPVTVPDVLWQGKDEEDSEESDNA